MTDPLKLYRNIQFNDQSGILPDTTIHQVSYDTLVASLQCEQEESAIFDEVPVAEPETILLPDRQPDALEAHDSVQSWLDADQLDLSSDQEDWTAFE